MACPDAPVFKISEPVFGPELTLRQSQPSQNSEKIQPQVVHKLFTRLFRAGGEYDLGAHRHSCGYLAENRPTSDGSPRRTRPPNSKAPRLPRRLGCARPAPFAGSQMRRAHSPGECGGRKAKDL